MLAASGFLNPLDDPHGFFERGGFGYGWVVHVQGDHQSRFDLAGMARFSVRSEDLSGSVGGGLTALEAGITEGSLAASQLVESLGGVDVFLPGEIGSESVFCVFDFLLLKVAEFTEVNVWYSARRNRFTCVPERDAKYVESCECSKPSFSRNKVIIVSFASEDNRRDKAGGLNGFIECSLGFVVEALTLPAFGDDDGGQGDGFHGADMVKFNCTVAIKTPEHDDALAGFAFVAG